MVIDLFLFLAVFFIATILLGKLIERWKIPWIFSALLIGVILAIKNPFNYITSSPEFSFLSQLGMLFLLFIIGFEIDLKKMKKIAGFIIGATFFIILSEALMGTLLIHYLFGYGWFLSIIIGTSFATVGEAILIPILDKFKITNTKLGQTIIGIGTFDDIFEILILIVIILFLGINSSSVSQGNLVITVGALVTLFVLTAIFLNIKRKEDRFEVYSIESLFLISLALFFLFLGVGEFANSTALAALLAGISIKTFLPKRRLENIENEMRGLCYGFFAPIFFLSAGLALNMKYLFISPLLVLAIFSVTALSKVFSSYIIGSKKLGKRKSIILGVGLSVRFSTSIIIIKILLDNGLIKEGLYSVIIASSILFTLIIPVLFSHLISRLNKPKTNSKKK